MELIDISVQDGRGLIKIAISGIHDRVRIQDYLREAEGLREMYNAQCACTDEWAEKYRAEVERKADATFLALVAELEQSLAAVNARLAQAQILTHPTSGQLREHERMRGMGQRVEVIDSFEGVDRLLGEMK